MAPQSTDGTGRRLGRYHLGESLGGGPTGVVYQAKVYGVAGFERRFAVKRFHDELVRSPSMAAKVAGAARTYGSLEHPHIARLHEFGVAGGETFTATELIEGVDLRRLIASLRGGLKPGSAAAALAMAARAVGFGHGRGHSHLGLCPTNILLMPDGQLKVTDFGMLPPRLPKRPAQDSSLDARIPFLAPEQLAGEPTSAATDVYQLGVMGYILFVGEPPFAGSSAFEVAQMIMSATAPEPVLARPIAKVLKRCLARSPFERYPDAAALADAIEEAAQAAALPGGLDELALLVQDEMKRLAKLPPEARDLPEPAPPMERGPGPANPLTPSVKRIVRGPGRLSTDALKKTMMGVGPSSSLGPEPAKKPSAPRIKNPLAQTSDSQAETRIAPIPLGDAGAPPAAPSSEEEEAPTTRPGLDDLSMSLGPAGGPGAAASLKPTGDATPEPIELGKSGRYADATLRDLPAASVDEEEVLYLDAEPMDAVEEEAQTELYANEEANTSLFSNPAAPEPSVPTTDRVSDLLPLPEPPETHPPGPPVVRSAPAPKPPASPAPVPVAQPPAPAPASVSPPAPGLPVQAPPAASAGKGKLVLAAIVAAVLGGGGFAAYSLLVAGGDGDSTATSSTKRESGQAGEAKNEGADDGEAKNEGADDGEAKNEGADDGEVATAPVDAGAPAAEVATLTITSKPSGAKIYLDGSELGKTPHTMDGTPDKHRLALILAGHKLHVADIEGRGNVEVTLEEVTPSGGEGGIKVRCKKKNRYYVFIDGKDAGQLCPTERIGVSRGEHTVEIYDPVTDSRSEFKADVQKIDRSHRVYVD